MLYPSQEGQITVPAQDIVSFTFDKKSTYNENKPVFVDADDPSRNLSTRSFTVLVRRLIAAFKALGLRPGECLLCQIPNSYFYPAIYYAVIGAGGIWCGSNPANQVTEVDHFIELAKPRFTISCSQSLPTIIGVYEQRQLDTRDILVLDLEVFHSHIKTLINDRSGTSKRQNASSLGPRLFTDLLYHGEQHWRVITNERELMNTPAAYYSTSGTTGLPKLAMVTHHNLVAHHIMLHQEVPYQASRLMSLPLFHVFATSYTFIHPIRYGQPVYIMKRYQLESYLRNISKYQLTEAYMAPPMVIAMLQSTLDVRALIKSLRYAGVGGAPIDAVCMNKMRALMATNATLSQVWGMTEIGVSTTFRYGENDETGSIGRLMRGMTGKLVDSDGKIVEKKREPGELYIHTHGIMLGYRNMSLPSDEKEWFRTGDVCRINEGKLYIVGRAKELIKVKGWQVAPAELESVLLQHPDIIDAAVVGTVATDGISEVPRAYIIRRKQLHESDMITAEEVYNFSRKRLASYKALDGGICFVEEIPRTPSGKIQRSKLSRMDQYRRSVTAVLMTSTATTAPEDQRKVAEIKDTAMKEVETAEPNVDTPPNPRRSRRISSIASQGSITCTDGLPSKFGELRVQITRKSSTSSESSEGVSPTRVSEPSKNRIHKRRTERPKRLVRSARAA